MELCLHLSGEEAFEKGYGRYALLEPLTADAGARYFRVSRGNTFRGETLRRRAVIVSITIGDETVEEADNLLLAGGGRVEATRQASESPTIPTASTAASSSLKENG